MSRHVFYSLHYDGDRSRVGGIFASKTLVSQLEAKPAEWDKIRRSGELAFKRWLEQQLKGRSCTVVLIGAQTASRPLVQYEIKHSRELKLALFGVRVHPLKDARGQSSSQGANPFEDPACGLGDLGSQIPVFEAPETDSKLAQRYIVENLADWAELAAERAKELWP
jgi:hypothetical protein